MPPPVRMKIFLLFQFLSRRIRIHVSILTRVQNEQINGHILQKNVLLKLNFEDEGHMYASFLVFILTIYRKCLLFSFLR